MKKKKKQYIFNYELGKTTDKKYESLGSYTAVEILI